MNAVDTSVLIYARDPRDPAKQAAANVLLASLVDGVLLWQVACEYVAASRKLEKFGYDQNQAMLDVNDMTAAWRTALPTWEVMGRVERLLRNYSLSFWDALLVSACLEAGVTRLYSEDFDDSVMAEGVEVINPFAVSP